MASVEHVQDELLTETGTDAITNSEVINEAQPSINEWVVVQYESHCFPGIRMVTETTATDIKVKVMQRAGPSS